MFRVLGVYNFELCLKSKTGLTKETIMRDDIWILMKFPKIGSSFEFAMPKKHPRSNSIASN